MVDESRFFIIEHIPADRLNEVLFENHIEGNEFIHILAERWGATNTYRYTITFERKPEPKKPQGFETRESIPGGRSGKRTAKSKKATT